MAPIYDWACDEPQDLSEDWFEPEKTLHDVQHAINVVTRQLDDLEQEHDVKKVHALADAYLLSVLGVLHRFAGLDTSRLMGAYAKLPKWYS